MMRTTLVGLAAVVVSCGLAGAQAPVEKTGGTIDLPSSKQIHGVVPGGPQRLNSLPVSMAVSPDGRWVVTINGGYGSAESGYMQSLAVMDTRTGKVVDYPDTRTLVQAKQTLFSGLAFSADGKRVYASIASMTDPEGLTEGHTGSGVAVYSFVEGKVTAERVIKIAPQELAAGKTTKLGKTSGFGMPYPASLAVVGPTHRDGAAMNGAHELLLVADNLSDDVLLMDAESGEVLKRFDLSENVAVPSTYPIAVAVTKDGKKGYVALWNASEVVELDLVKGVVGRKLALLKPKEATATGSHPDALALAADGKTMYVALGNRDSVAAVDLSEGRFALKGYFDARLPGQSYYGAQPEALALNADGSRLYVADMNADAVAVMDTRKLTKGAVQRGMVEPVGFIPTEWLPMAVTVAGGKVYIASGKGTGTGPNNMPAAKTPEGKDYPMSGGFKWLASQVPASYAPALLHGSLAVVEEAVVARDLGRMTAAVLEDNRMKAAQERIAWDAGVLAKVEAGMGHADPSAALRDDNNLKATADPSAALRDDKGKALRDDKGKALRDDKSGGLRDDKKVGDDKRTGPIKHVIYIIKENRTYDQLFGDLGVGNGDPSLTMYGAEITPNQHKLAMQFGVLDNFYDSGEVSGDGHVWSNAGIGSDALERTWQINYRGGEHTYDYEGVVAEGLPLEQRIPDVVEPQSGYIWGNLAKHGMTLYHFGEFISSVFCTDKKAAEVRATSQEGPMREGSACASRTVVKQGEKLPEVWGGGVSEWPWDIPLLASDTATKPELVGHFAEEYPDFNLNIPDQVRVGVFLKHLDGWVADRKGGKDTMPNFVMLRLANDHTSGTTAGKPSPKAAVADNDLAIGRAVEAVSGSAFWEDTAFFILEDDAQNGADHVDAHRSLALVVSKYAPHGDGGKPFVDSKFYSTVSMIRTMETVLGLPPMNHNDALSSLMGAEFGGAGDQPAFVADWRNKENGLIYTTNLATAVGAKESAKMDFRHADRADARKLNVILWQDAMGAKAVPSMLTEKRKKAKKDDDD